MPVNNLPVIIPLLLIAVPPLMLFWSRRAARNACLFSLGFFLLVLSYVFIPGWLLRTAAESDDPVAQYRYAQWLENHSDQMNQIIIWPSTPNVFGGFDWLKKSAESDYPPAVWLVGVRLKHGIFTTKSPDWAEAAGNSFAEPKIGQRMIDRAVNELGFKPPGDEEGYYWQSYRQGVDPKM